MTKDELEKVIGTIGKAAVNDAIAESDKITNKVARSIGGANQEIVSNLEGLTVSGGIIQSYQLASISRMMGEKESEYVEVLEDYMLDALSSVIDDVIDETSSKLKDVPFIEGLLTAELVSDVKDRALEELYDREINKATTGDRIKAVAAVLALLVLKELKYGILTKETITAIQKRMRGVILANLWQVKRLVSSEMLTATRIAVVTLGEELGILKGIRIIDNRGRHGGHHLHKCYEYAETDKYGLGKGVYMPKDKYILDPHPYCTAYLEYILKDGVVTEGVD